MGNRWLTPDTAPAALASRCLFFPDAVDWIALVAGALIPLTFPGNFEQYGTATPEETAAAFLDMFDDFSFNSGVCRVIGEIVIIAGTANPNPGNWLACDGASLVRTMYPDLFAAIGTTYGSADGTHFNLPDIQGRIPVGTGSGTGLTPRALGDSFGEETHTLTTAEIAAHGHTDTGHSHTEVTSIPSVGAAIVGVPIPSAVPGVGATGISSAVITSTGGDGDHNNLQPSLALNYFIVAL